MSDARHAAHPAAVALRPGLVRLPHAEPHAQAAGVATNAYAVLARGAALLVDAGFADVRPMIAVLAADGFVPSALVLTHRHVVAQSDALGAVATEYGIPLLLSPRDAAHPQARAGGLHFEDPVGHPRLEAVGVQALPFPGHTPGHVVLYAPDGGGVLLAGDCAMGATRAEAAAGVRGLVRPPVMLTVDDGALQRSWRTFDRPLATVCPFHGEPLVDDVDAVGRALATLRADPPTRTLGVGGTVALR